VLRYPRLWEPDNAGVPVLLILDLQADCAQRCKTASPVTRLIRRYHLLFKSVTPLAKARVGWVS